MNKRTKLLAEQAGIVFWEISGDVDWRQADKETLAKFAELIVRECGVALNPPVQNRNVISRGQAYDLIKKHFGVDE